MSYHRSFRHDDPTSHDCALARAFASAPGRERARFEVTRTTEPHAASHRAQRGEARGTNGVSDPASARSERPAEYASRGEQSDPPADTRWRRGHTPGMVSDERSEPHARTGRSRANRGLEPSEGPQRRAARAERGGPQRHTEETSVRASVFDTLLQCIVPIRSRGYTNSGHSSHQIGATGKYGSTSLATR
jgi:hypothetical protein